MDKFSTALYWVKPRSLQAQMNVLRRTMSSLNL